MREIKFRAKKTNGEWVYGYFCKCPDGNPFIHEKEYGTPHFDIDPETVGQFTELKDKNNKEIYDGDLLKNGSSILEVRYKYGAAFAIDLNLKYGEILFHKINNFIMYSEIIGNIHEKKY